MKISQVKNKILMTAPVGMAIWGLSAAFAGEETEIPCPMRLVTNHVGLNKSCAENSDCLSYEANKIRDDWCFATDNSPWILECDLCPNDVFPRLEYELWVNGHCEDETCAGGDYIANIVYVQNVFCGETCIAEGIRKRAE